MSLPISLYHLNHFLSQFVSQIKNYFLLTDELNHSFTFIDKCEMFDCNSVSILCNNCHIFVIMTLFFYMTWVLAPLKIYLLVFRKD